MKRLAARAVIACVILAAVPIALPASLEHLADTLSRTAEDYAADSYRSFRQRSVGNRADVEALYMVYQFARSATLFRQMVNDRRPRAELRDATETLRAFMHASERYAFGNRTWRDMGRMLEDISQELSSGYSGEYDGGYGSTRPTGQMRWRGRIDDEVEISVQGDRADVRTISGASTMGGPGQFTSPLPKQPVNVRVSKKRGRGTVEVVQQPAKRNGFTAVIRIRDPKGGSDDYELEVVW
jgi:hypothetical protein